jgi:hypothetical protein
MDLTYADLKVMLDAMTPEQLAQTVQIFPPHTHHGEKSIELWPVIEFASVGKLVDNGTPDHDRTRSAVDNEHHPEQMVLMVDLNPFSEDGDTYYELTVVGLVGNKTGKILEP